MMKRHWQQLDGSGARRGFTMIEVAISLAIVAFALVALIGVLPTGMKVQKENREETIVNQDGMFWLETIRSASRGMDDLTNYIDSITVNRGLAGGPLNRTKVYSPEGTGGDEIIGLLSTPRFEPLGDGNFGENRVRAQVRAVTGLASEKTQTNELSFRYQMEVEIVPFDLMPTNLVMMTTNDFLMATNMHRNLYEIRLTLRWPLYEVGDELRVGRSRKSFRTLVSGDLQPVNPGGEYFFFRPNSYSSAMTF